uniref:Zinc finger protein 831 n=1 Tax=Nannospalax galili TaxID=1026970 RepID=A0A8C6R3I1_NANGA
MVKCGCRPQVDRHLGPPRRCGMEASEPTCAAPPARDQPAPTLGISGGPGGQASPRLTLGPVILPTEQGLPQPVFLKALPVPLYHTVPPGSLQPRAPLVTGNLEGASVPFILSPLLQPEGPSPTPVGKPVAPALTVNIVGTLPVLSPGLGPTLSSTGKVRNAGKYLCPHCGRDCLKPSVLEKHIRSHTGERPFPCATCGIAFKTQSNLYKHRRTQTHLNNSRLSLESEAGGTSLLEEGDRAGEPTTADNRGDEGRPEGALSPGAKGLDRTTEAAPCPGSTLHREAPGDGTQMSSPGLPLASPPPRRKLPEPKPCSLQRQQETCLEKPGDPRASEGRLRKCESTDSGYLSRSDSAEQPPVASSPLHSLSEHSAESEGEGGPGARSGGNEVARGAPGGSLELEKKKLEERIARLISHNQAVVDDPQLDHVRPRKTVLSKQGSIDLPMPYTYKDSFHFDIRALEPGRRRTALSPAHSTITPLEKSRPLFFHSVPTQLSTAVECVPVTRSNSLPFIEGSRIWTEPLDPREACPRMQKPLSPRLASARSGCHPGLTLAHTPSGHPRALVRQAAVEDLPCTPTADSTDAADLDGAGAVVREGTVCKGRVCKKYSQKKPKMFSQEKWQVYGNETFKRIYQKMKTSHQGGQKSREVRQGHRTEPNLPSQKEVAGSKDAAPSQDRTSILGDSSQAKPRCWGSQPAPEGSLETESPKQLKAVTRAKSSPTLGSKNTLCLSSRSPLLPPGEKLGCQLSPGPGPLQGVDLEASGMSLPDSGSEVTKETCPWAQTVLRQSSDGFGDPQPAEKKFPSERKRLKVEGLDPQEQPEPLGAGTSGSSVQTVSRPPQKQDSDPGELLAGSYEGAQQVAAVHKSVDASSAVSDAALRCPGPGDKTSPLPSVPRVPGHHSLPAARPQTPGIPVALEDDTFAPKYLLRLPQGENSSPPATPGPEQGPDSLCTSIKSEEQASLVGSGLGTPWSPGPSSHPAPGEAEDPSWSKPIDRREGAQMGREKGGEANSSIPASRNSPGSSTGATWGVDSILPTYTSGTHKAQDMKGEPHAIHYCCTDSPSVIARTSGGLLNPWTFIQKLGVPPKNAPEGPLPEPKAGLPAYCPFQAHHLSTSFTRPQGVSLGQPKLVWTPHLGMPHLGTPHLGAPRSCGAQSAFPSLRAEPQLTWCCLSRSLPVPSEQQGAASGHSALPDRSLQDEGSEVLRKCDGGRIKTSQGGGEGGGRGRGGGGRGAGRGGRGGGGGPMQAPGVIAALL